MSKRQVLSRVGRFVTKHGNRHVRRVHSTRRCGHGYSSKSLDPSTAIRLTFIDRDGQSHQVLAPPGKSLLEIAHANEIDLEGACEGSLACSTCHVYLDEDTLQKLEEPCDDENDMLDLAFALTEQSRLGCQVIASKEVEGLTATLPPATRNMAVDGFVPQPH